MDSLTVQLLDLGPACRIRAARHQAVDALSHRLGFGPVCWRCPWCGGGDHGMPTALHASVSTSSHGSVLAVVFDPFKRRLGIDLTSAQAPPEADGIASTLFTASERRLAPGNGWHHGQTFARVWSGKEALAKAHGCGLAVDHVATDGGILDTVHHALWLRDLKAQPVGLVGLLALETEKPEKPEPTS